ncbi:MAG: hypothetical protein EXX96DRAFT_477345 [Benjaminiella poitrasii]|nr:MAG: hypothetical protein EXX96DRAFT_477345 [Benjaminiella poitrasii]
MYQQTIEIPLPYYDLIAALVQDSDEPCTVLTSRINDVLSPFLRNERIANKFDLAIEKVIKQVAHKCSYGLKQEIYDSIEHTAPNIPWVKYKNNIQKKKN